jgi:histidyl-tRNA synthetase
MAKHKFHSITGMQDILPRDRRYFDMVEKACFKTVSYYGYDRIETPVLENTALFEKGTGQSTDIVQKQMYSLKTEGGDELSMRPEFTPSIIRAFLEHGMTSWVHPVKLAAFGPVFRHERPGSGRYREFRQFEIDAIGEKDPALDVQVIFMFYKILQSLGIRELDIQINSIGCAKCRPNYKRVLRDYYRNREKSLCKDCRKRLKQNTLRVLDCDDEKCERLKIGAPEIVDYLCSECHNHLKSVLEILDSLEVPYMLSSRLVRGLDYYTKTVFEIFAAAAELGVGEDEDKKDDAASTKKEGSKEENRERAVALASGGRFDDLVELLGGSEETPAVGGAMGVERVIRVLRKAGVKYPKEKPPRVFFVHLGELAKKKGMRIMEDFRSAGINVKESFGKSSIRAQMAVADKMQVDFAVILGHQEVAEETIIIRDMKSGSQEVIPVAKLIKELKKLLKK